MTEALESAVAQSRLGHANGKAPTRRFTIARGKALLQLRRRPMGRWEFCRDLLRAALMASDVDAEIDETTNDEGTLLVFSFSESAVVGEDLAPAELLQAALDPRPGPEAPVAERWRSRMARAINGALALDPRWIEVRLVDVAWRYERTSAVDGDPYRVFARGEPAQRGLELHVALPPANFGRSVRSWLGLGQTHRAAIAKEWSEALLLGDQGAALQDGRRIRPADAQRVFDLGGRAQLTFLRPGQGVWLTRGGVAQCSLDAALAEAQVPLPPYELAVESERVNLDIDERRIVQDQEWATIRAWISDVLRSGDPLEAPFPAPLRETVTTASGASVAMRSLTSEAGDVPFVWADLSQRAPASSPQRAVGLWPSEVAQLRELEDAPRLIPIWLLPQGADARFDPEALQHGAFEALELDPSFEPLIRRLAVHSHRYAIAEEGRIRVVAWSRTVATFEADTNPIRGVTLLVELDETDPDAIAHLLADGTAIADFAQRIVEHVWARIDVVLAHVWARAQDEAWWQAPLLRWMLERIDAATVGLHYALTSGQLRLAWREHPLSALPIGVDLDGEPKTLRDALERMASAGGIVSGEPDRRWVTLESDAPQFRTWFLTERGRGIVSRVLGRKAIWDMPVAAGAMPRPAPADEQRHLLLTKTRVGRLLERRASDGRANQELLGHLLVARVLGEDEHGLDAVPLLRLHDPNAASPRRKISLQQALELPVGRVAPLGTPSAGQVRPFVEVAPGFAELLRAAVGWNPAPPPPQPSLAERPARTVRVGPSVEVRARTTTVWVREPVVHRLCAGAVHLGEEAEPEIELWGRGARLGAFRLPRPLRNVGGRVWLTDAGVEAGRAKVVRIVVEAGRRLQLRARVAAELCEPGSNRAAALHAFAGREDEPVDVPLAVAEPLAIVPNRPERLASLIRHALGRPVQIETRWLSWTAASVEDPGYPGVIEIGQRHTLVNAALESDASARDVLLGAAVVVAHAVREAPQSFDALAAFARLLATAGYAQPS